MIRLVPMNKQDYQQFISWAVEDYARGQVRSGNWQPDGALERGKQAVTQLLPQGFNTPDQHMFKIINPAGTPVGGLWFGVREEEGTRYAALYELVIYGAYRRQGYGTLALQALEEIIRAQGLKHIVLHVFGYNQNARDLYRKSGYLERNVTMVKEIS